MVPFVCDAWSVLFAAFCVLTFDCFDLFRAQPRVSISRLAADTPFSRFLSSFHPLPLSSLFSANTVYFWTDYESSAFEWSLVHPVTESHPSLPLHPGLSEQRFSPLWVAVCLYGWDSKEVLQLCDRYFTFNPTFRLWRLFRDRSKSLSIVRQLEKKSGWTDVHLCILRQDLS